MHQQRDGFTSETRKRCGTHDGRSFDENGLVAVFQPAAAHDSGRDVQLVRLHGFLEVVVDVSWWKKTLLLMLRVHVFWDDFVPYTVP